MKYNDNGEYKDIYVKAFDTLPVGTEVNFNGTSADIPNGWEQVGTSGNLLIIEKTSQYIEGGATLPNYSTEEIKTGSTWIDGKPIYRKVINIGTITTSPYSYNANLTNVDKITKMYGVAVRGDNQWINLPYTNTDLNYQVQTGYNQNSGNGAIVFNVSTLTRLNNVTMIYEYTKTTD